VCGSKVDEYSPRMAIDACVTRYAASRMKLC
jgi:hypothetical protein